jgi:zinc transport system substrate-binding protein
VFFNKKTKILINQFSVFIYKRNRMEKTKLLVIGVALVAVLLVATFAYFRLTPQNEPNSTKIGIIVTILPQAEFAEKVGGNKVAVTCMVPPGGDPHTYEPTPSQLVDVSKAKVYAEVGSGVDFELVWMDKIIEQNKEMLVIDCSNGIKKMNNDPHIWNSPINAKSMVENICSGLIDLDPDNEDYYTKNKNGYLQELDTLNTYIHERLDNFTNRAFLIYHPAFGYFAEEYNLTQLAIQHGGKDPTPQIIQSCIDLARQYNLSYVFEAPQFATQHAETIAHEIGGQTLFMDPLPTDYISNMRTVADSLSLEMEA